MKKSKHVKRKPSAKDANGPAPATPDSNPRPERDAQGRFTAGNGGGPGNPFARRVAELRQVIFDCVTAEDLQQIVGQVVVMAKAGDLAAVKLLLQYVVGKPAATVEPDTLDVQEMELYSRAPAPGAVHELIGARMPTELARNLMRTALPYVLQGQADALRDVLLQPADQPSGVDNEAADPDPEDKEDMDDDEVFARLDSARQAAANASPRSATAPAPDAQRPAEGSAPSAAAPSPNGSSAGPRRDGHGPSANGKHDPSANGSNNGHDDRPNKPKRFPFDS